MKPTKCIALVKKVLSPFFQSDLRNDLQTTPYSILVDESTDISTTKILAVSAKYYSVKMKVSLN